MLKRLAYIIQLNYNKIILVPQPLFNVNIDVNISLHASHTCKSSVKIRKEKF